MLHSVFVIIFVSNFISYISYNHTGIEFLQNSIMRHVRKDFDCLKLQMCMSIIDISISYQYTYSNSIMKI